MALSKGISLTAGKKGLDNPAKSFGTTKPAPIKYNTPDPPIGGYNPAQVAKTKMAKKMV